ncbi:MAG: CHAT domain-containing protein [Saprospiraceae bacterium]|nr:CHAT domain-containing protein [Saprospiraceae bacterium]
MTDLELGKIQSTVKLLVLSACQTAEGKMEAGEGIYSLSRSFLQGGIPNVVASLWEIDNASTSDILTNFYTQLRRDNNPAIALNQAKRNYLQAADKQTAHPKYWAGLLIFK